MKIQQDKRRIADPREEMIIEWYFGTLNKEDRENGITAKIAWDAAVNKNTPFFKEFTKLESMIVGSILRNALHLERKNKMVGGDRAYRYFPTDKTKVPVDVEGKPIPSFMDF